jgi:glycosyltransferase involved in cell wall biosynthesis
MRLGILTSHPIQYQAPWFRGLAKEVDLEVFFSHRQSAVEQGKAGFGKAFQWDVDLLSGYKHRFLTNVARNPGVNHFWGCDTPGVWELVLGNAAKRRGIEPSVDPTSGCAARGVESESRQGRRFDAFVVTGWHLMSYWQAVRGCHRADVPVLVRGDSQLNTPRSWVKRWGKEFVYRILMRQFDGFLVVGQRNREYLSHYGVKKERMFFTPHFVDNEWFAARAAQHRERRAAIRRPWGASEQTLVVLFVGKFIPKKRPRDILLALAILIEQRSIIDAVAVFVGAGELERPLRDEASLLGVQACFEGFKNQSELPACYVAADVLVLPSDGGETWGLVVNEAMACGLPAIVSDAVGCSPDLIQQGQTGFTFPMGDVQALRGRLQLFAAKLREGEDFQRALAKKLQTYSVDAAVQATVDAVRVLASRRTTSKV